MKTSYIIIVLGIAITGSVIFAVTFEFPSSEYYELEITGLKETYLVGEPYSFSYIVSGYGYSCGSNRVTFPINQTDYVTVGSSSSCVASPMMPFYTDILKTYGRTYGNIGLEQAGNYTVTVWFERGINGSTEVTKSFLVVDSTKELEFNDDFDKTWGGPGNRHPAFLGYDIPEICSNEMVKHLVRYSSMFDKGVPYAIEDIGLENGVNIDNFDKCVESLLENRNKDPSWSGK